MSPTQRSAGQQVVGGVDEEAPVRFRDAVRALTAFCFVGELVMVAFLLLHGAESWINSASGSVSESSNARSLTQSMM